MPDPALAHAIRARDKGVDDIYKQLFRELLTFMYEDPRNVSRALHLLLIARNYERMADHAANIAEDVIYLVEGQIVRHEAERRRSRVQESETGDSTPTTPAGAEAREGPSDAG